MSSNGLPRSAIIRVLGLIAAGTLVGIPLALAFGFPASQVIVSFLMGGLFIGGFTFALMKVKGVKRKN